MAEIESVSFTLELPPPDSLEAAALEAYWRQMFAMLPAGIVTLDGMYSGDDE